MVGMSPVLNRALTRKLMDLAEGEGIPFQTEVMGGSTGTNSDCIAVTRDGVKCAMLSIPQRNMHTPAEIVDLEDIENTARLLAAYIREAK